MKKVPKNDIFISLKIIQNIFKGMKKELKEAFRIYDKAGNGYIPISALKEILHELGLCISEIKD